MTDLVSRFTVIPAGHCLHERSANIVGYLDQTTNVITFLRKSKSQFAALEDLVDSPPIERAPRLDLEISVMPPAPSIAVK
ncbi:hypothetical protein [Rhodococcus erythropolis]|uniref:hypothetical protein n=1 Tax=Rhodococcus erythropolis TaxID=1833 RepID=UPI001C9ABFA2|nr:hypothetical protein [Rhodococcus erythropolis]